MGKFLSTGHQKGARCGNKIKKEKNFKIIAMWRQKKYKGLYDFLDGQDMGFGGNKRGRVATNKKFPIEKLIQQLEEFHRFSVLHKMKFMTYLLEMTYIEALSLKSASIGETSPKN